MPDTSPLRNLPSVDAVLRDPRVETLVTRSGRNLVVYCVREVLAEARRSIADGSEGVPSLERVAEGCIERVGWLAGRSLRAVVNATGVVLHTNLGRAPLGKAIAEELAAVCMGYTNLEFDLTTGRRGKRGTHTEHLLRYLTGAEQAVVANNNAAAIILVLSTLAKGREVIVSRGELIEIGGAFRVPEIMAASGAVMVEVGATNRTRLSDYADAVTDNTAVLFKAHKSNYSISGFTGEVSVGELAALGREKGLPVVYDIGSGLLRKPKGLPLEQEPDVRGAIAEGADIVTFSCDKLLGGPQAGVAAGRSELIAQLATAPLMRALRVGKLTIAALSRACRSYLTDAKLVEGNPTMAMLEQAPQVLSARAVRLRDLLRQRGVSAEVTESTAQCGGGTLPDLTMQSSAVVLVPPGKASKKRERFAERVFHALLRGDPAVLCVLREGRAVFDVLTLDDGQLEKVADAVVAVVPRGEPG